MNRVFSGIQPTGSLHLGNYLGALRRFVAMQDEFDCIYCIVDLHAITMPCDPGALRHATREAAAGFLAAGLDPERCIMFNQSQCPMHTRLGWMLSCLTPLGWLNRMTQFKEKAGKKRDHASLGLYGYPVLQAADILGFRATHVPVGEDQKQHLELSRDIAGAFNRRFGVDFFPLPEPVIAGEATRVMSLRDGTRKMSKSDESDYSRINLTDDRDTIARKFRKARTDSEPGVTDDPENRPEASNLIAIYAALADSSRQAVVDEFASARFSDFKERLTELAVEKLGPVGEEMKRLAADPGHVDAVLRDGAARARSIAEPIQAEVEEIMGFLKP
ncbi:MAG: tryptophan--tRNA ligase [Rhodospirillales bacterium]|nr:tryptophan--tRNA ligase [Rhodospirillales bacterium]